MKILVAVLVLVALVLGGAGTATFLVERRLSALFPGGMEVTVLRYNPYSGGLTLTGLRGRDAAGRVVFEAEAVEATADPLALLTGSIVVRKVHVVSPRVVLAAAPGVVLVDFAAALGGRRGGSAAAPPLVFEGLMITGGSVVVENAGEGGGALAIGNIDVRLNRLAAAAPQADLAFAVDMAVYGTSVQLTGQPLHGGSETAGGYAVHVRARGLDIAAVLRDFPLDGEAILERGRGDVEGDVMLTGGRLLVSGHARVVDVVARVPGIASPVQAASATVVVDRFDVGQRAGRISRVDLAGLTLTLARPADGWAALRARVQAVAREHEIVVRRLRITDSVVNLVADNSSLTLRGLDLALSASERSDDSALGISGRATVGRQGVVGINGVLARDLRALDALVTVERLDLAPWRDAFASPSGNYEGLLGFDGRLRFADGMDGTRATMSGQATLTSLRLVSPGGGAPAFSADSVSATVRRLDWPEGRAVLDALTFTRPTFISGAQGVAGPWPLSIATGAVTVVDGRVSGDGFVADALSVEVQSGSELGGAAHVRLTAVIDGGNRLGWERWLPGEMTDRGEIGLPLSALFTAVGEAYHSATPAVYALPRAVAAPAVAVPREVAFPAP